MLTTNFWNIYITDRKVLIEAVIAFSEGFLRKENYKNFRKNLGSGKNLWRSLFIFKLQVVDLEL